MSFFRYDGPLAQFLSKVFDLLLLNVLWFVGCIPIVTLGASTTALYSVLMKLVKNEEYTVLTPFLKSFKENFKQATIIWLMLLAAILVLGANLFLCFFGALDGSFVKVIVLVIAMLLAVPVVFILLYVFPLQAGFYNPVKQTVQNALIIALSNLPKTLLMVLLDVAIIGVTGLLVPALSFFTVILVALLNAWLMNPIFAKYTHEEKAE